MGVFFDFFTGKKLLGIYVLVGGSYSILIVWNLCNREIPVNEFSINKMEAPMRLFEFFLN